MDRKLTYRTETLALSNGAEIYFSVEKNQWHWCVCRNVKNPEATAFAKYFHEWYFTKHFALREMKKMLERNKKLEEKMKFEENYKKHLEAILEKEDER